MDWVVDMPLYEIERNLTKVDNALDIAAVIAYARRMRVFRRYEWSEALAVAMDAAKREQAINRHLEAENRIHDLASENTTHSVLLDSPAFASGRPYSDYSDRAGIHPHETDLDAPVGLSTAKRLPRFDLFDRLAGTLKDIRIGIDRAQAELAAVAAQGVAAIAGVEANHG
ncbi:MAG TPA: hypothetical protein VFX37_09770 [Pseudolabrys sp.]|nr:hypothetical protein [Pseudolabrys sp.]